MKAPISAARRRQEGGQFRPSRPKAELSLVTNGKYAYFILRYNKSVQGQVTGLPVCNNELAQIALDTAADQRVRRKAVDRRRTASCVTKGLLSRRN
jgi:hypothetical protein